MTKRKKTPEEWREVWMTTGQLALAAYGPTREDLEAILRLNPTGLEFVKEFQVSETGKMLELMNVLMPRRHELKNVTVAVGRTLSSKTAEAFVTFLMDITTLERFELKGSGGIMDYGLATTVLPRALNDSTLWPELKTLCLRDIVATKRAMQAWCRSLSEREHLVEGLVLDVEKWHADAWPIFIDAIPRLRLKRLQLSGINQEIYNLCERLDQCDTLEAFALHTLGSRTLLATDRFIKSIDMAVRQMPSLTSLSITQFEEFISGKLWVGLGRIVASRPSLRDVHLRVSGSPTDRDVKEFLHFCGYHPNLKEISFVTLTTASRIRQLLQNHIDISQSCRARCLVVLIAGATIERVGSNSSLWKINKDILRKLLTFLPGGY